MSHDIMHDDHHSHAALVTTVGPVIYRAALIAAAIVALLVTGVIGLATYGWVGTSFPGFFVLPNRVIPSVGRLEWSGSHDGAIYQRMVVAVDGKRVDDNADVYRRVSSSPSRNAVEYTLRHGSTVETLALESRIFSRSDYWMIFGGYLLSGSLFLMVGLLGAWMFPDANLGRALLLVGGTGGIFALSGAGIYAPHADMRVHALAEAFFPATLVYLALVFSGDRSHLTGTISAIGWWLSLALAIPYQLVLSQPGAYSALHAACETYLGVAGLGLGATLIVVRARAAEQAGPLLRASLAGALIGLGVPAMIMAMSGVTGGGLPVNVCAATAFLFPPCIAYGLLRERALRAVGATAPAAAPAI